MTRLRRCCAVTTTCQDSNRPSNRKARTADGRKSTRNSSDLRRPSIDAIRDYVSEATAGTADEFSPPPELPPELAGKVYPPAVRGAFRKENRRARYLDIEVEVTVANAERLSRIVVENVKHELKAVVNARMMTVEDKLFEFRQTMRTLNRRR